MAEQARSGRSLVVLAGLGLVGGGLAALAGTHSWVTPSGTGDDLAIVIATVSDASAPLTTALSLVVLAAWGVVLVSRGWFRRVIVALAALASVGVLVASVVAFVALPRRLSDYLGERGFADAAVDRTWWGWLALLGAVLATVGAGLALTRVGTWPEMGRRYDAPTGDAGGEPATEEPADLSEADGIELWKQLDQGRDPTV